MIDRLYDNGMLVSGEAQHCNSWEYPTMPRLNRPSFDGISGSPVRSSSRRNDLSRKRGYVAILLDAFRSR